MNLNWFRKASLVIAHRGASAYAPENTMAAFIRAFEIGADAVELDAKLTKDGVIAIIHDGSLDRTTTGNGRVNSINYREIRELDAGKKFSKEFEGERVPSLREVFEYTANRIRVNIELTNYTSVWDNLPEKVIELVTEFGIENEILISSFSPIALIKSKRIMPDLPIGLLVHEKEPKLIGYLKKIITRYEFFHPQETLIQQKNVNEYLETNKSLIAWTVNEPGRIKELLTLGIAGIITDVPDIAIKIREEHSE
ncbi:MAG: hypothetical protein KAH97_01315 [Anaerolineales bacterium]|nr:hypothetical protein [Anaerolineales bacterium]